MFAGLSNLNFHHRLDQVPKEFSFFIAHEFFDALPIHKFVRVPPSEDDVHATENSSGGDAKNATNAKWREVLVDVDEKEDLRFVRARHPTPGLAFIDQV